MTKTKAFPVAGFTCTKKRKGVLYGEKITPGVGRITVTVDSDGTVGDFECYDEAGHYLGFTAKLEVAEQAAEFGWMLNTPDSCSELELWDLWNNVTNRESPVYCPETLEQIVGLGYHCYLVAKPSDDGWSVRIITDVQLGDEYFDETLGMFVFRHMKPGELKYKVE